MSVANADTLQRIVRRYGVKRCYKSLTWIHGFDPEISWLSIWYCRHNKAPKRTNWYMDTYGIIPAPITEEQAKKFLSTYTDKRGGG